MHRWRELTGYLQCTVSVVIASIGALEAEFSPVHLYTAPLSLASTRNTAKGWKGSLKGAKYIMAIPSSLVFPLLVFLVPSVSSLSFLNHLGAHGGLPPLQTQVNLWTVSWWRALLSSWPIMWIDSGASIYKVDKQLIKQSRVEADCRSLLTENIEHWGLHDGFANFLCQS